MRDIMGGWLPKPPRRTLEARPAWVRAMEPGDIQAVQNVARRAWADTYHDTIPQEVQDKFLERAYSRASLERRMVSDVFLVAVLGGEVVGFADFESVSRGAAYLGALYVAPEYQRRGIGELLLREGIAAFPPATRFTLRVEGRNVRAQGFYRRHGFKVTGEAIEDLFGHESREVEMMLVADG